MIDLYYWTTPNGHKVAIFLEEAQLPYKIVPINIGKDEQFGTEFLKISPNNKIPAIVDHAPLTGDKPLAIFESGAILIYLAQKANKFASQGQQYYQVLEWLLWQCAGFGPMSGQYNHFLNQASDKAPYATERFYKEVRRLYNVLEKQLDNKEFMVNEYSIADMATYPWVRRNNDVFKENILEEYPNIKRWYLAIHARPAVQKVYENAKVISGK